MLEKTWAYMLGPGKGVTAMGKEPKSRQWRIRTPHPISLPTQVWERCCLIPLQKQRPAGFTFRDRRAGMGITWKLRESGASIQLQSLHLQPPPLSNSVSRAQPGFYYFYALCCHSRHGAVSPFQKWAGQRIAGHALRMQERGLHQINYSNHMLRSHPGPPRSLSESCTAKWEQEPKAPIKYLEETSNV